MQQLDTIQLICIYILPILFAVTVHEVAHGWMAYKLGDPTAFMLGRLTLNPLKHIDLVGTVIVPLLMISLGGVLFGWARPVPINWRNLHHPRRDVALVALAGPASNLLMAIIWAFIGKLGFLMVGIIHENAVALVYMGAAGVMFNVLLMVLNLIPIPPLDGSRIIACFLPTRAAILYARLEPYGFFIIMFLLFTGTLLQVIDPIVALLRDGIMSAIMPQY
jgi:Zn-dependent protease